MRTKTPLLSIIIPTLNEEKYLPKLLRSIKKQDFKDYEIIVADYNSKDKTRKIAKRFGCKITKGGKPAAGRNNGAKIAKGDILFFLDADVVLPKGFLSRTLNEFRKKDLYAATCFSAPDSKNLIDHIFYLVWNVFMWIRQFFNPVAPGYCILTKKEAHNRVNGFDETLFLAEDHDYVKRISRFGKFRVIHSWLINSTRRIEKEGRLGIALKYIYVAFYRIFRGEVRKDVYKYEFGKYN